MTAIGPPRVLVYYFGFPHYRQAILSKLLESQIADVRVISGSTSRGGIPTLTSDSLPGLIVQNSWTIGPFSWDLGVLPEALSSRYQVVVLGPALSSLSTWAVLIGRFLLRRRTFLWGQCGKNGDRSLRRRAQEVMNRLATGLFVYGLSEATAAASLGTRASKIEVVHNATRSNADKWGDMASRRCYERLIKATEAARSNGQLVLTFIGRLTPEKKVASLLDAIEFLADRYPGIKVYIVGDGPSRPRLERHQQRRHCVFLGPVYDEEVLEAVLKETTLAISPDRIGLFAIDALRAGVPVLVPENSANGPEIEALALGVNALSFEAGNPRSIAECVDRWFELVPSITESQYVQARNEELRKWDSSNVADSILLGCMLDTDN